MKSILCLLLPLAAMATIIGGCDSAQDELEKDELSLKESLLARTWVRTEFRLVPGDSAEQSRIFPWDTATFYPSGDSVRFSSTWFDGTVSSWTNRWSLHEKGDSVFISFEEGSSPDRWTEIQSLSEQDLRLRVPLYTPRGNFDAYIYARPAVSVQPQ